jgi:hypothetical protein
MAYVRSIEAQAVMEIRAYGERYEADPSEVVRMVLDFVRAEAPEFWATGGRWSFQPAPLLLNFLLDVEAALNGAANSSGKSKEGAAAHERTMHCLRVNSRDVCSPRGWEPDEQCAREPASHLHALSFVLARHAEAHGQATIDANASANRVGVLRAAGNAIVPQVAAVFVMANVAIKPRRQASA